MPDRYLISAAIGNTRKRGKHHAKGEPNKNTVRVDRYQKNAGYKVKGFKLKGDVAERFAAACEAAGVGQAAKIIELMEEFIKSQQS